MRRFILRVFFFLRQLIFADRGQSAKFAKIRTRKIFMLHGNHPRTLLFFKKMEPERNTASNYWQLLRQFEMIIAKFITELAGLSLYYSH